jgi:hypothetical protein
MLDAAKTYFGCAAILLCCLESISNNTEGEGKGEAG